MSVETLRILSIVFLAFSLVFAIASVVLFRVLDIKTVRGELTGKAADLAVSRMREARAGSWYNRSAEAGKNASVVRNATEQGDDESKRAGDSISFRMVSGNRDGMAGIVPIGQVSLHQVEAIPTSRIAGVPGVNPFNHIDEGTTNLMGSRMLQNGDHSQDESHTSLMTKETEQ